MLAAKRCSKDRAFPNTSSSGLPSSKNDTACFTSSGGVRRVCSKEIASRHLSSSPPSSSKSNSSSISTFSSPSSSSSSPPPHFPSPFPNPLPTTPALSQIRSKSLDRTKTSPECADSDWGSVAASRTVLRTTSRSLSVSFQGESFFYQTTKVKPTPEKSTAGCRKPIIAVVGVENSQPNDQQMRRCPTARSRESNLVTRRLDYSVDRVKPVLMTVRLLLDETNLNVSDRSQSPDSDGLSSASILSFPNSGTPAKPPAKPRGICVPARFRQENGRRGPHAEIPQKLVSAKQRQLANTQIPPPRFVPSPLYGPKPSSPREDGVSKTRRTITASYSGGQVGNAPSIISFASGVRRAKKGEGRIEDAHMLRLLHNRYLQWRYINSRAENSSSTQLTTTKDTIYNAWITILELHDSAMNKQILLQIHTRNLKLASILKEQIAYLEEWSTLHEDHEISVKGALEALEASTLRLPVIDGAKMDIQEVKAAVNSATDVTQAMAASMGSSLSKVEAISSLVSELSKAAAFERSLLNQSRELLSMVAALHVKQCSLRACILQLERGGRRRSSDR